MKRPRISKIGVKIREWAVRRLEKDGFDPAYIMREGVLSQDPFLTRLAAIIVFTAWSKYGYFDCLLDPLYTCPICTTRLIGKHHLVGTWLWAYSIGEGVHNGEPRSTCPNCGDPITYSVNYDLCGEGEADIEHTYFHYISCSNCGKRIGDTLFAEKKVYPLYCSQCKMKLDYGPEHSFIETAEDEGLKEVKWIFTPELWNRSGKET